MINNEVNLSKCKLAFNEDWIVSHSAEEDSVGHRSEVDISSNFILTTNGSLTTIISGNRVIFSKAMGGGTEATSSDRSFTLRFNFHTRGISLRQLCVVSNAKFIELYRMNNQEIMYVKTLRGAILYAEDSSSSALFQHSCEDSLGIDEFHLKFLSIKAADVELSLTLSNFELHFDDNAATRNDYMMTSSDIPASLSGNRYITTCAEGSPVAVVQSGLCLEDTRPIEDSIDQFSIETVERPLNGLDRQYNKESNLIGRDEKSDASRSHSRESSSSAHQEHLDPSQLAAILWTVKSTLIDEIAELLDAKLQPIVSKLSMIEAQLVASSSQHI